MSPHKVLSKHHSTHHPSLHQLPGNHDTASATCYSKIIIRPQEAIGRANSQSPLCCEEAARNDARSCAEF